jgi:hypothetical protein
MSVPKSAHEIHLSFRKDRSRGGGTPCTIYMPILTKSRKGKNTV